MTPGMPAFHAAPASPDGTGDPQARPAETPLADLVRTHQAPLWRYLRLLGADAAEADDLVQEAFVQFATRPATKETIRDIAAFLRGMARNLLLASRRRAANKLPTREWVDAVEQLAAQPDSFADDRISALQECIETLTGRARQAIEWHHLDGVSYTELAARLQLGAEGVKSLLARSRQLLRDCIQRRTAEQEP